MLSDLVDLSWCSQVDKQPKVAKLFNAVITYGAAHLEATTFVQTLDLVTL